MIRRKALLVHPQMPARVEIRQALERMGLEVDTCPGPPQTPCPVVSGGRCPTLERTAGLGSSAFFAVPLGTPGALALLREYRRRFGRVVAMDVAAEDAPRLHAIQVETLSRT